MTKLYSEKKDNVSMASGKGHRNMAGTILANKSIFSNSGSLRTEFLKFIYLALSLAGLAGTLVIIYNVISIQKVDSMSMILVFLFSCIPMTVMVGGLYGFSSVAAKKHEDLNSDPKRISTLRQGKNKTAAFSGGTDCPNFSSVAFNKILYQNQTYS